MTQGKAPTVPWTQSWLIGKMSGRNPLCMQASNNSLEESQFPQFPLSMFWVTSVCVSFLMISPLPLPVHTTACLPFTQQFWSRPLALRISFCLSPQSQSQFPEWVCYIAVPSHCCFKHALSCFPFLTWCGILDWPTLIVKYFITIIFPVCIGSGCSSWGLNPGCQARHPMPLPASHLLGLWSLYFQVSFGC